jgi:purine-binding chemotaxis protein CheW
MESKIIVFQLGAEAYGIPITQVKEIIKIESITKLPNIPKYIQGVINTRGKVHIIYNFRVKFNMDEKPIDDNVKIVVTNYKSIGFIVDEVSEIITVNDEDIENTASIDSLMDKKYISGIVKLNDRIIIGINIEKVLNENENIESDELIQNIG